MAAVQSTYAPLLNPDRRPLPAGWTQHYDPDRKLWIYLDMNVLPPRATLTHPVGPQSTPPRRIVTHDRPSAPPQWSTMPFRQTTHSPRERPDKTLAQQLYSSALPPVKKGGLDEFGMRTDFDADEIAPSYGSIDTSAVIPFTAPAASPVAPQNTGRRPARRPLPRPPVSGPAAHLPQPPDPTPWPAPIQPTPVRPTKGPLDLQIANNVHKVIPQQEPEKSTLRSKPPSYSSAMRPAAMRQLKSSHTASNPLGVYPEKSSPKPASPLPSKPEPLLKIPENDQQPSRITAEIPISSLSILLSSPTSEHITTSPHLDPSRPPSSRSSRASPVPSAPSTPEPAQSHFTPNRRLPFQSFAPPGIVAMANRHGKSPSLAFTQGPDAFDPSTLYMYTLSSPKQVSMASPASNPRSISTPSPSTRTSLSMSVSPMPSQHSSRQHSQQIHSLHSLSTSSLAVASDIQDTAAAQNNSDDSEGQAAPAQPVQKKGDISNRFKKIGMGFSKMASKGTNGLKDVLKKGRTSKIDLLADSNVPAESEPRISADAVGKVIDDGFMAVMGIGGAQLANNGQTTLQQSQFSALNVPLPVPMQPQSTGGTWRANPTLANIPAPIPNQLPQIHSYGSFSSPWTHSNAPTALQQQPAVDDFDRIIDQMQAFRTAAIAESEKRQSASLYLQNASSDHSFSHPPVLTPLRLPNMQLPPSQTRLDPPTRGSGR